MTGQACIMKTAVLMAVLLAAGVSASSFPQGRPQPCANEGETVELGFIKTNPCITCKCLRGLVICEHERCPEAEACHLVLAGRRTQSDSCCEQCKGCQTSEGSFSDGDEWQDPADVCKVNHCHSGVVTKSDVQCHAPCSQPLAPEPGQCCRRCPGCLLAGHVIQPGHNMTSPDEPCLHCACDLQGRLSCVRRVCPALSCPESETARRPGHCCSTCTGTRRVHPGAQGCQMGKNQYDVGQTFTLDPCTVCTCQNGTSVCSRSSCPKLPCPRLLQEYRRGQCCPVCRPPERVRRECRYMRRQYKDGQTWKLNPCTTCNCTDGEIGCEAEQCAGGELHCGAGHHQARVPGHCCPQCVEDDAVCTVFGDPHYNTFDGKLFNYQGTCKYQLAKDCADKTFSIRVHNDPRNSRFFSWTRSATIKVGDLRIALRQKKQVKINRKAVDLPYIRLGQVSILQDRTDNFNVLVKLTSIGISVVWDGDSFLQVKIPPTYKGKMCGLCGNFNGNKTDDFTTKRGRLAKLTKRFARSWRVGGQAHCAAQSRRQFRRQRRRRPPACGGHSSARANAVNQCNRLKSAVFFDCHSKVHPATFWKSCLQDMCECDQKSNCYCEALTAYSHACQRSGVRVDWLNGTDCAERQQCAVGGVFVECSRPCEPSCEAPDRCAADGGPCQPGCACPEGTVLHQGACVSPERCPGR